MQAIDDSTLLEQCKKALDTTEPISMTQQKQLDVVQSGPPQGRRQHRQEEEETFAPPTAPAASTHLDLASHDVLAADSSPLPVAAKNLPPPPAGGSKTAPPAPPELEGNDDFNFYSHFLAM